MADREVKERTGAATAHGGPTKRSRIRHVLVVDLPGSLGVAQRIDGLWWIRVRSAYPDPSASIRAAPARTTPPVTSTYR